ncbi:hypothetical protein, conserved [Eimeria acervulina]|uniref:Uncharacterized protein n=1 Tax=Eimeria acervulina TaxID=5801 RepID=U6GJI3_EIMAC|nr:hypothetical protein, conserved [Eimeria acervulina]CDI80396.1 hypothetical protein, conserved [Eimeria acervulina]
MEASAGEEQKDMLSEAPRGAPLFASTPKRSSWLSSSSNNNSSSSSTAAAAAAAATAAAGPVCSPQRAHCSHTIEEIRARLKPRIQSGGGGGSGVSTAAPSFESLPISPSLLRQRLQSDGAVAAAAAASASAADSPRSSNSSIAATAAAAAAAAVAEPSVSVHREEETPSFRSYGLDPLDSLMRRRQTAAAAAAATATSAAAAAAGLNRTATQLDAADAKSCLLMLHELLEAAEAHRQQSVKEAQRLRGFNSDLCLLLQQANSREQQIFIELAANRSLLAEAHNKILLLERSAEEAAASLRTQRDTFAERLQVVEAELARCTRENEQLRQQQAANEASLRELAAIRESHGAIEREKKQLQSELEAQAVASSRLLNDRIELQGQLHRLQAQLQEVETPGVSLKQQDSMKQRMLGNTSFIEETDEDSTARVLLLLQQFAAEVSPHLGDNERHELLEQQLLQQGAAKGILEAFQQLRAEKNEFHGYALELLNRLDALGLTGPPRANSQGNPEAAAGAAAAAAAAAPSGAAAATADAGFAAVCAAPDGVSDSVGTSSSSSSSSLDMAAAQMQQEQQQQQETVSC